MADEGRLLNFKRILQGIRESDFVHRQMLNALGMLRAPMETLARISGTDKVRGHEYMDAYERFFSEFRNRRVTLLEIGVLYGQSLDLWEAYFQRGTIVGIDLRDETCLSHGRVHVHQCSQVDREGLEKIAGSYDGFNLIVDDGSHLPPHQIESFGILFPFLKSPGIYVIEDIQTSYWPVFGGGSVGSPAHAASTVSFFKALADGLNHAEYLPSADVPVTPFHREIRGIYFEHNLIVILKGDNSADSNWPIHKWSHYLEQHVDQRHEMPTAFSDEISRMYPVPRRYLARKKRKSAP